MSEISVIVVSWNARDHLRDCLVSVRESGSPLVREIIVVDNASTDGSPEMVAAEFPDVTLIRSARNLGFAKGNNVGLAAASGSWLALVNSDVIVHPNCLRRLLEFLREHDDVGLVGPKVLGRDGQLQRTCRKLPTLWNTACRAFALDNLFSRWPLFSGREMRHWSQDSEADVEVLSGCFWMARGAAVERVGQLDERFFFYAEDVDWCKRFWDAGWKVVFVPKATATHFGGGSSARAPLRYSVEMLRANRAYWRKHHGLAGQVAFLSLSIIHHALRLCAFGLRKVVGGGQDDETVRKWHRSVVCLGWFLNGGKCVSEKSHAPIPAGSATGCQKN
jgi:GT2 family glycosyltransferase